MKTGISVAFAPGKITCEYSLLCTKNENGMFSWYIPGFDIYFSSKTEEVGLVRADSMLDAFLNHFLEHQNLPVLINELKRLGFIAMPTKSHESSLQVIHNLLKKKSQSASFKARETKIPFNMKNGSETVRSKSIPQPAY